MERIARQTSKRRAVSVLFNEPKLLKYKIYKAIKIVNIGEVSVLFNEPKLLKCPTGGAPTSGICQVSVLFNEPKLLKSKNPTA